MTNIEWIRKGNTGCTFATLFAKNPKSVGWENVDYLDFPNVDCLILSIDFPSDWTKEWVRAWALQNGFFEESLDDECIGLRIKCEAGVSWVQYFGPDSHVKTRRTPNPMLMYTQKLNTSHYVKVGYKGVLHLAHAFYDKISERVYDLLWNRSYKQTEKLLGHRPTLNEAAKTTWIKY